MEALHRVREAVSGVNWIEELSKLRIDESAGSRNGGQRRKFVNSSIRKFVNVARCLA
jgi:hypothetical protein